MRPFAGFSRIELLVAMAVFAVLAGLSARSAADALANGRSAGYRAALADTLLLALNHSIAHSRHVVVCTSADGATCGSGDDWTAGWIAWEDLDGNRERDADDRLLRAHPRMGGGVRLHG
jgi:prepilin-type N-terminal cleavage/methylation domain-containing protein